MRRQVSRKLLLAAIGLAPPLAVVTGLTAVSLLGMLHVPRRGSEPPAGAETVQISASDGAVLQAFWLDPRPTGSCVLFLHGLGGTGGSVNRLVPMLRSAGYAILAPDSRAHGRSGGDIVTFGLLEKQDAIAWTHWMRGRGCAIIDGLGESLGASVLIQAAAVEPVFTAIVADSPYADLLEEAEYRGSRMFPFPALVAAPLAKVAVGLGSMYTRLVLGADFRKVSPVEDVRELHTPVLLIHGTADRRTPPSHSERLHAANPGETELWLVPGAGHVRAFRTDPDEYRRRVLGWFAQAKGAVPTTPPETP